jgi:hypothetical protein
MAQAPWLRRAAFVLVVALFTVLGLSLLRTGHHPPGRAGRPAAASHRGTARRPAAASHPGTVGPPGHATTPRPNQPPASSPPPDRPGRVPDIYRWLPFTRPELASAAGVTLAFCRDYASYSYTESPAAYLARLGQLVTPELAGLLGRAYAAPGLASQRASKRQVATAAAVIRALRAFGPSSITFVVSLRQTVRDTRGAASSAAQYAVTLSRAGTGWQVSDIEPASAGNS